VLQGNFIPSASPEAQACRVCASPSNVVFQRRVLDHDVSYFDCPHCSYLQTEPPYWLDRAYANAIGDADTGIMLRNQINVSRVALTLTALRRLRGRVLDIGGGYGILVRMLRDIGIDARWQDKHCKNLLARGFEDDAGSYDLVTAFEVVEHLVHPVEELRRLLAVAPAVLLSTELAPDPNDLNRDWWYLAPEYGQHIGFLRKATLEWIARELDCHFATDGRSTHLFVRDRANARYWSVLRRLTPLAPRWARLRLKSRTFSDFESARVGPRSPDSIQPPSPVMERKSHEHA
jgi:Methyltransferase domain